MMNQQKENDTKTKSTSLTRDVKSKDDLLRLTNMTSSTFAHSNSSSSLSKKGYLSISELQVQKVSPKQLHTSSSIQLSSQIFVDHSTLNSKQSFSDLSSLLSTKQQINDMINKDNKIELLNQLIDDQYSDIQQYKQITIKLLHQVDELHKWNIQCQKASQLEIEYMTTLKYRLYRQLNRNQ